MGSASFKKQQKEDLIRLINNVLSAHHVTRYSWHVTTFISYKTELDTSEVMCIQVNDEDGRSEGVLHFCSHIGVACVAAVSFPFPNVRVRKSGKISSRGRGWVLPPSYSLPPYFSSIFWLTPGVLLCSPSFRSLVRSPRGLIKERNRLLRRLIKEE